MSNFARIETKWNDLEILFKRANRYFSIRNQNYNSVEIYILVVELEHDLEQVQFDLEILNLKNKFKK